MSINIYVFKCISRLPLVVPSGLDHGFLAGKLEYTVLNHILAYYPFSGRFMRGKSSRINRISLHQMSHPMNNLPAINTTRCARVVSVGKRLLYKFLY